MTTKDALKSLRKVEGELRGLAHINPQIGRLLKEYTTAVDLLNVECKSQDAEYARIKLDILAGHVVLKTGVSLDTARRLVLDVLSENAVVKAVLSIIVC